MEEHNKEELSEKVFPKPEEENEKGKGKGRKRSKGYRTRRAKTRRANEKEKKKQKKQEDLHLHTLLFHLMKTSADAIHVKIVKTFPTKWLGQFVSIDEASSLEQTPLDPGCYYYFQDDTSTTAQLRLAVIRPSDLPDPSFATALANIHNFQRPIQRGKNHQMQGEMYAHGFRYGFDVGGIVDRYVPEWKLVHDMEAYSQFLASLDAFADSLQMAMNQFCPIEALEAVQIQRENDLPSITRYCPMGNLTVTHNFASTIHFDEDKSWAIGQWFGHEISTGTNLGAFVFPELGLSVPFTHGVVIIWHSSSVAHGTAIVAKPSTGKIIGTSIQITQILVTFNNIGGHTDWLAK